MTKCPSKFTADQAGRPDRADRRPRLPDPRAGVCLYGIGASLYGARTGPPRAWSPPAAARSTRWPACSSSRSRSSRRRSCARTSPSRSSRATPRPRRRSSTASTAMWSSQEGSLLLWVLLLGAVVERDPLPHPPPAARGRAVRDGRAARLRRVLLRAAGLPRVAVRRGSRAAPAEGVGPEPAPAPPEHDDPPADALLGLHAVRGAVRVRGRRAGHAAAGRGLDPPHAAVHARRLVLPRHRASCSARAGRTPSSAGAATGPGTRSRTRR